MLTETTLDYSNFTMNSFLMSPISKTALQIQLEFNYEIIHSKLDDSYLITCNCIFLRHSPRYSTKPYFVYELLSERK